MAHDDQDPRLFAAFIEARSDKGVRQQWVLFPPALAGFDLAVPDGTTRMIKRRLERAGHRAKWQTIERGDAAVLGLKLQAELDQYESTGWRVVDPIVIRLETDDYRKAMAPVAVTTPYKALRHVDKVAQKRGYSV